jgi:hypothetical protein
MQFIMKKINDHAGAYNEDAHNNDPFTGIAVHAAKIRRSILLRQYIKTGAKKSTHQDECFSLNCFF